MDFIIPLTIGLILIISNIVLLILWGTTKKHIFGILIVVVWLFYLISNNKTYASFWKDFHQNKIVSVVEESKYGEIIIDWSADQENFFNKQEIKKHASLNEWVLSDSLIGSYDSLKIFIERFDRFNKFQNDYHFVIFKENVFNYLKPNNYYRVYFFSTNVQAVSISTADVTIKNGIAVISSNGKKLNVYHYWGEL